MPLESRCSPPPIRHCFQAAAETAAATVTAAALWTLECVGGRTSMLWHSRSPFVGASGSQQSRFRPAPPNAPRTGFMVNIMFALVLLPALVVPIAGGQGELCVVETPLKTQYFTPVVETLAQCHGCRFPAHTPTPETPKHTPPIRQVHIVHVEDPEGGAVEVVMEGSKFNSKEPPAQPPPPGGSSRIALVLFSSRERGAPVVFTVTAQGLANDTKHVFLVSGEDEVRGSNLRYSIAHKQRPTKENLISSIEHKFGFVSSYTRVPKANKIILQLPADDETGPGCDANVADTSPTADCFISIEQPVDGCYHHNMLGENDRDIHIIEVDGSSNSNGSLVLSVVGSSDGGTRAIGMAGGNGFVVERNITLVLRTSRPTTWSLHAANIQGTITLLVGGGDQVENTSVPGPGVIVEVRRLDVPATFDQLILTVLTNVGPPVSYTRTTSPNKITITVPPRNEKHIVLPPYIPEYEQTTVYGEDRAAVINGALSVSCDSSSMTVAIPRRISSQVGGISMSLSDHSCLGVMNETHIYITERFEKCKFKRRMSTYQTTYTNHVHIGIGPSISDDEDFDGSGYGSNDDDDYYVAQIKVQCQVGPRIVYPEAPSTRKTNTEPAAGATYKMDVFRDREHQNPVITSDLHTSINMNQRLYVRTVLASVMPWTAAYDANLQIVLEECWLSNSSTLTRPDTPHETLVRKSCALNPSVALEQRNQDSGFSFKVLPDYAYLGSFYLHCQLGICSGDPLPRPAVNKCLHPGHYCDKIALMRLYDSQPSSSSLQTLTLGPFAITESTQSALSEKTVQRKMSKSGSNNVVNGGSASGSSTDEKTRIVNLGGLSTEVVVGIALASFVIGVCLTATLWLIHMKTDPHRQKRPEGGAPRNSGYDLSAHSGSSTPSSQAPMTA
ncbi:transforming growth factor beta receptor type 3-like [Macrobrachium nipponense]|uniref:transforming growth factor beta receptor type 3-like n=1 Tax=Macrobrachium nipponense TaxID=159736 RepID=UPI0030C7BE33